MSIKATKPKIPSFGNVSSLLSSSIKSSKTLDSLMSTNSTFENKPQVLSQSIKSTKTIDSITSIKSQKISHRYSMSNKFLPALNNVSNLPNVSSSVNLPEKSVIKNSVLYSGNNNINNNQINAPMRFRSSKMLHNVNNENGINGNNGINGSNGNGIGVKRSSSIRIAIIAKPKLNSGEVYEGEYVNGKMHGQGFFKWNEGQYEGDSYNGNFFEGYRHGKGMYIYNNGNIYDGEWNYDEKHGKGVFKWNTDDRKGDFYEGEMKNGRIEGRG